MTAAPASAAAGPDLPPRPVTVRLGGPDGPRALLLAADFDFEQDRGRATVFVDGFGKFPRPGLWYWIGVAGPHPQAGAYLARFQDWYNACFYFVDVRRLDAPAAPDPN